MKFIASLLLGVMCAQTQEMTNNVVQNKMNQFQTLPKTHSNLRQRIRVTLNERANQQVLPMNRRTQENDGQDPSTWSPSARTSINLPRGKKGEDPQTWSPSSVSYTQVEETETAPSNNYGEDPTTWSPTSTESQRVYHVIWDEAAATWITSSSSTLSEFELNIPQNNYGEDPATWSPSQTDSTLIVGDDPATWGPSTQEPIYGDDPATYSPTSQTEPVIYGDDPQTWSQTSLDGTDPNTWSPSGDIDTNQTFQVYFDVTAGIWRSSVMPSNNYGEDTSTWSPNSTTSTTPTSTSTGRVAKDNTSTPSEDSSDDWIE